MSTRQPSRPMLDRIAIGGLTDDDLPLLAQNLRRLLHRMTDLNAVTAAAEISVKDRDRPGMTTTLEVWILGLPPLVATSVSPGLPQALNEVSTRMLTQINTVLGRRNPKTSRKRRAGTRELDRAAALN